MLVKDIMNYMPQMKYMFANVASAGTTSDPAAKRMKLSWPELLSASYPFFWGAGAPPKINRYFEEFLLAKFFVAPTDALKNTNWNLQKKKKERKTLWFVE